MKIKALLVGCEGKGRDYLPGVSGDIKAMRNYLKSDIGGQWKDNEIIELQDSCKNKLIELINQTILESNDFVLFYFAGHGSYSDESNRKFYINDSDYLSEYELQNLSHKQICIFDSCAGYEENLTEKFEAGLESRVFDSLNDYRHRYLEWIKSCPAQKISLYACSEGEDSEESSKGGLFTQSLINCSIDTNDDLSIIEAFKLAQLEVSKISRDEQNPDYSLRPRSGTKLPFRIK